MKFYTVSLHHPLPKSAKKKVMSSHYPLTEIKMEIIFFSEKKARRAGEPRIK
jgi:hypothetical protein